MTVVFSDEYFDRREKWLAAGWCPPSVWDPIPHLSLTATIEELVEAMTDAGLYVLVHAAHVERVSEILADHPRSPNRWIWRSRSDIGVFGFEDEIDAVIVRLSL